jgi:hypothetical protein
MYIVCLMHLIRLARESETFNGVYTYLEDAPFFPS